MGRVFRIALTGAVYACKHCQTHVALEDDVISEDFRCSRGKAYLVDRVENVWVGEPEIRHMMTGHHTVVDIFCVGCGQLMGWRYETVMDVSNKYKEGKFILERCKLKAIVASVEDVHPNGSSHATDDAEQE